MCPASRSSVCTRWVRLLKALASSKTRIGIPSLHDLGANLIPGDYPAICPEGSRTTAPNVLWRFLAMTARVPLTHLADTAQSPTRRDNSASRPTIATGPPSAQPTSPHPPGQPHPAPPLPKLA